MYVRTYDFNALANWPIPVVARISSVTSKLQAIVEKKRGGSDVSEARRDYGRRNIVADVVPLLLLLQSRTCCIEHSMQIGGKFVVTVVVTNPVIDGREVIS